MNDLLKKIYSEILIYEEDIMEELQKYYKEEEN